MAKKVEFKERGQNMNFTYYQPTRIIFGPGSIDQAGPATAAYGTIAMLVVDPNLAKLQPQTVQSIRHGLITAGLEVVVFDKVMPNPVLLDVQAGSKLAREKKVNVMVGLGGGSTMDTARAIAVAATHPGTAMDYLYFSKNQPTNKTLPIVQIPTTSGTGSHVSCCAVITDPQRQFKSALWNRDWLFARATIVDPQLMLSLPPMVTASTGFDVFTHAFESYININASWYTDLLALESIKQLVENLPKAVANGRDLQARQKMAWADTLAGICIANAGTTLPHAMGQPISGHYPHVSHGQSLAVIYPAFLEYTAEAAVDKFAAVARIFNPHLHKAKNDKAAEALKDEVVAFLMQIGLYCTLEDIGVKPEGIDAVLKHCMEFPDVKVNPKVPDTERTRQLYMNSFKRDK